MKAFATLTRRITVAAMASLVGSAPALAAIFVYVSNAEDGDIGVYKMIDQGSGTLKLLNRYPTGKGANWVEIVSFD